MQTSGNTMLITGGTSGIGLGFALEFLKRGNTVIICGRREDRLEAIRKENPEIVTRVCDVADASQRENLCRWIMLEYPRTNVLINNAGIQLATRLTDPVPLDRVRSEVEINFIAPVHLSSMLSHQLASQPQAAIINITSGLAFAPLAHMPVYCATKAALHSLTLSMRYQFRHTPVQVFEIIPPSVDTELGHDMREDKSQSHGGMPIKDFLRDAMTALENDMLEAPVGPSVNLRAKREEMFPIMNR
ncbi:SDR family oxidoreductase [Larkinella soli]|uniref:SDR family oxidoreductase n=1 Tax=Larkinella soli TaxID=1770527 RepID=UPI000FFC2C51|nr:SDR family NAD(P)-dependent oxidoreductase [Larkinella soli]